VIAGQQHEAAHTDVVFEFLEVKPKAMLMDKGFISNKIIENMKKSGTIAVTPAKTNAVKPPKFFPKTLYKARSRVENFFCRLKKFRRTEFRFEKKQCTFLAFIFFAATIIWIKSIVNS
jgi:hypothetical protein